MKTSVPNASISRGFVVRCYAELACTRNSHVITTRDADSIFLTIGLTMHQPVPDGICPCPNLHPIQCQPVLVPRTCSIDVAGGPVEANAQCGMTGTSIIARWWAWANDPIRLNFGLVSDRALWMISDSRTTTISAEFSGAIYGDISTYLPQAWHTHISHSSGQHDGS
eukprot:3469621-Amphidinium_carterae.1